MTRDEILIENPLVDFVRSRGYALKPAGENFVTNGCPETKHKRDHRPVTIDTRKHVWHCNDCGKGGTIIDWLMIEKDVSASEALRLLGGERNDEVRKRRGKIVATYDYCDASGKLLFQVVRTEPKDFFQRRSNGEGGWIWDRKGVEPVLFRLPEVMRDVRDGLPIYVCEGEKDVLAMVAQGFSATCNPLGAKKWRDSYSEILRGADVVIIADKDSDGREHAQDVASKLHGVARFVRVLELPDSNDKTVKDSADFFAAGGTAQQLQKIVDAAPPFESPEPTDEADDVVNRLKSARPKICLPGDGRLLSDFAAEIAKVLKDCGIYQRSGIAFIVNERGDGFELLTPQMLRTLAENYLVCLKFRAQQGVHVWLTMTEDNAKGVLAAPQFLERLPKVRRIHTARLPVLRRNGKMELLPAGHDPESLTLTLTQCEYRTDLPLKDAREVIDNLLCEFPFRDGGRSKAVAISAMVGIFAATLLDTRFQRPVFLYLANAEGAGKTLLAKCAVAPTHGTVKIDGDLRDRAETDKELLAAVMAGRSYLLFDNCKRRIDSPALESLASSAVFSGRILGQSKMFQGENLLTVLITGNGATITPDLRRRSLIIELFSKAERAEDRTFARVLDDAVLSQLRPRILTAMWALVREWDNAGRPKPSRTHSAFPEWAELIGGIIEHAGYGCPLETAEIPAVADVDGSDMHELVELLNGSEPVKFDDLIDLSRQHGLFERIIGSDDHKLDRKENTEFGRLLAGYHGREFPSASGRFFIIDGKGHSRTFRVLHQTG